jgi:hypothetical protein
MKFIGTTDIEIVFFLFVYTFLWTAFSFTRNCGTETLHSDGL